MADSAKKNDTYTKAPDNVHIDDKVVKKVAGEALAGVKGVLGIKGGLGDFLKDYDDPSRGIDVTKEGEHEVSISAKVILETGRNIPATVNAATAAVTGALHGTTGLKVKNVCVEVIDTMTKAEYDMETNTERVYPDTPMMM